LPGFIVWSKSVKRILPLFVFIGVVILWCFNAACSSKAQQQSMGVVVISHGAPIPQWNETVMSMISTVKSPYPVEPAFLDFDKERTLTKAAKRLEDKGVNEILIVHVSTSSYSSHHEEVRYLAGLRKDLGVYAEIAEQPLQGTARFAVSPCMDDHPLIVEIVKDFARELSQAPTQESLMLVGHGPVEEVENIMWVRQLEKIGQEIQKTMPYREVACMTLRSDSADLIREQAHEDVRKTALRLSAQGRVIVVICGLGIKMLQFELQHLLKGIPSVAINQKGFINHPNTKKWIEATIQKGMQQPEVPPINRKWTRMDQETGKPQGTTRYGML
jgi:sirohydrochlorin ferrochelatase